MAPSHYLKQCWIIVNWTLRNKLQWNFNRNSNIFIQENAFEHVVCQMASIFSRPQWVKTSPVQKVSGPSSSFGKHSAWVQRCSSSPTWSETFFGLKKLWLIHKTIHSLVENECSCPCKDSISNVNLTNMIIHIATACIKNQHTNSVWS